MTKDMMVRKVAQKNRLDKKTTLAVIDDFINVVLNELIKSGRVQVVDLGVFTVVDRKAKIGTNPQTNEKMVIPAKKSVRFLPAKRLREDLNG